MERAYYAVVEIEPGRDASVWFPDFPGCVSAGSTPIEALINAREALQFHIDGMIEDGAPIPEPGEWNDDDFNARYESGRTRLALVSAFIKSKAKRINVTIDEALLALIEARTNNVSGFLAEAARDRLKAR
jgi:predicted RNase H-like HicB family nuclease